jgi:hypothetical protein
MRLFPLLAASLALAGAAAPLLAQPQPADLEAAAEQAAAALRDKLPMQVDAVTTAVGVRADGAQFVYDMRLEEILSPSQLEERQRVVQQRNQANMCNGEAGAFIRRGGSMRHVYTDREGNQFETRVARCPPAE